MIVSFYTKFNQIIENIFILTSHYVGDHGLDAAPINEVQALPTRSLFKEWASSMMEVIRD